MTEGTISLLTERGGGRKERERGREKHNSHSVILEKLSPGTSKEIESVDDETSPAKYDKTKKKLEKETFSFPVTSVLEMIECELRQEK